MPKKTNSGRTISQIKKANPPNSHNDGSKKVDGNRDGGKKKLKSFEKGRSSLVP